MAKDLYADQDPRVAPKSSPSIGAFSITPSDDTDLLFVTRGIAFSPAGTLKLTMADDSIITIPSGVLNAGVIHPLRIKRIWATGTGASNIIGFY
jgi:hypothetical protein